MLRQIIPRTCHFRHLNYGITKYGITKYSTQFNTTTSKKKYVKTAGEELAYDTGLANFMKQTYVTSGLGIAGTLSVAQCLDYSGIIGSSPMHFVLAGFVTSFGCSFAIDKIKPEKIDTVYGPETINPLSRKLAFGGMTTGMGVSISPMVEMCNTIDPTIFPMATGLSLAVMGGASLYAYKMPSDKLLAWRAPLMGGLAGLVGVGITSIIAGLTMGFDSTFATLLHNVDTYGGIALFTGLTAYDTQEAIKMYKDDNPDHLSCATDLYLNFVNFLVRFMEIIAKAKSK